MVSVARLISSTLAAVALLLSGAGASAQEGPPPARPSAGPGAAGVATAPVDTRPPPKKVQPKSDVGPKARGEASGAAGLEGLPANAVTVRSLIVQKRLPEALRMADAVLRRYPNDMEVALQRARLLFWLGKPKRAEKAAVALYRRDNRNFGALRLVGDIRQQRGDKRGAIRAYREAQLRGDPDVALALRLISLYLAIGEPELALAQLRPGMDLPDEMAFQLGRARHPWLLQAWGGLTHFNGQTWRRVAADATYTWSSRLSLYGGLSLEDRGPDRLGVQASAWLFFTGDKVVGDVRLAWSPLTGGYLPPIDIWGEAAYRFHKRFSVGLWARYANYEVSPLYTIGPYVPIYLGKLTLKPGYLLVVRGPTVAGDLGQVGHTFFFRSRWEQSIRTAFFAWFYYGQEAVFNNRSVYGPDESGPSLVVGWDQWFGDRWGIRLMGTVYRQLEVGATMFDVLAALRLRL